VWSLHHPTLHIKLGLVKQFIIALDFEGETLQELRLMFPKLSEAKVKAGIFTGPQVKLLLNSTTLESKMTHIEKQAWCAFHDMVTGLFGQPQCFKL
jgi:hypothetical protein